MERDTLDDAIRRLERSGHRATPQRLAVLQALLARQRFVTAQELHLTLRPAHPHLALATVYRTLELLLECGLAVPFPQADNEVRYAFCSERDHHHVVCTSCGLVAEVPATTLATAERELERQSHFAIIHQAITFLGTCQACLSRAVRRAAARPTAR